MPEVSRFTQTMNTCGPRNQSKSTSGARRQTGCMASRGGAQRGGLAMAYLGAPAGPGTDLVPKVAEDRVNGCDTDAAGNEHDAVELAVV